MPRGVLPTQLLPHLPRAVYTLSPLEPAELLAHMAVLKELYMPPIHGGFLAGDVELDEGDRKRRTLSGGAVDLPALGLQMEGLGVEDEENGEDPFDFEDDGDDDDMAHNDPFEREWAEKWLNGVVRRAQAVIEEAGDDGDEDTEAVMREATAVLSMMAGTSAAGSLTRHLLFPLAPELAPALRALRPQLAAPNPALSPETGKFLQSLATSPVSPMVPMRAMPRRASEARSVSPTSTLSRSPVAGRRARRAVLPVLLHDAPMSDHISVGVQTWGSAILLGREMALRPADFGLFPQNDEPYPHGGGVRVLELGAGTGLLSILCRKLLDLRAVRDGAASLSSSPDKAQPTDAGLVVATDFHPDVLANLRICVDLNAPPRVPGAPALPAIEIAKLDWTTFPAYMAAQAGQGAFDGEEEELARHTHTPFDLVLASDCVYDPTHAAMLRAVASWVLCPPEGVAGGGGAGGTMHLLSPIRPTFTPELESIDEHFPTLASYPPLAERAAAAKAAGGDVCAVDERLRGEGLGAAHGLRLGVRGEGKKSVRGRKGEGRTDEVAGYWWWEVGWG
ncbi:hypothetical protein Q8F55_005519 [Vanrija albida]|uniref:Uncharacterized protein n=1 Tax=Vanrija albida TaxID=181172 RepID=A0ABR3Q2M3_9TREE